MLLEAKVKKYFSAICLAGAVLFGTFTCVSCSSGDDPVPSEVPGDQYSTEASIGPEGGAIEDSNGARIEIPPGALDEQQTIKLTAVMNNDELPEGVAPLPCFRGALQLEPDGLSFDAPVTITVPVNTPMTPGDNFFLFYWNETTQIWEQTSLVATVADDGMSFSAEVSHFSTYGGGAVENLVYNHDLQAFIDDFTNWFQKEVPLGKRKAKDNECFKVVGYDFDLEFDINGDNDGEFWRVGKTSSYTDPPLLMVDYSYDVSNGNSFSGYVRITVTIYYECTEPDFTMMSDRSVLSEGESTGVDASLSCAGTPLQGRSITFDIGSGPGEVNPGNTTTNSAGKASATFTAGDDDSVVKAYYYACEFGDSITMEREWPIATASDQYALQITFSQTTSITDYYDTYSYSGSVAIEMVSDNGDGSANVAGSNTFEVNGSGAAGDCTTTLEGSVTFNFSGTLTVNDSGEKKLNLTQTPDFSTSKTIYCPDDTLGPFPFLTGGETSNFSIPVENGHTIEQTISVAPITSHITYILTF